MYMNKVTLAEHVQSSTVYVSAETWGMETLSYGVWTQKSRWTD